ncbi:MAG: DNA repair protein RecN [Gammaproteobacteria bacterium]|nr:DNA repair protein RecN [Gammaproteobacteria bacterium]
MLTSLRIKNFAIVAELELDFQSGMTAFTGETGAGKSIMIDALLLALGERADSSTVIRPGTQACDIQACFSSLPNSEPTRWLDEHEINTDEGEILLRRVINDEGRSKAYINGVVFPLQKVKELSQLLVHIHGQHQHQTLLAHPTHREQLDQFAQHADLRQEVSDLYRQCQKLAAERDALLQLHPQESDALAADLQELQTLNPTAEEVETLHQEHQLLHHAKDYLEQTQYLSELLQADETPSVRQQIVTALHTLTHLPQDHPRILAAQTLLEQALIHCDEALDELTTFSENIQIDPERLMTVETRMAALHQLARKHQVEVKQLHTHVQTLEDTLQNQQNLTQRQAQIEEDYLKTCTAYDNAAIALRASRVSHANALAAAITANIQQLGMPHGYITIDIQPLEKRQAHGLDKIEYNVSSNPGMRADTLNKIASGGELSRISLAIQMITAQQGATPTLLFDEVDVGIGGTTAAIVGRHLRTLGQRLQLFCVTHQPQVAASAHHHFVVKKNIEDGQTFSQITPIYAEHKVEELARMLGGLTITSQTRSHAEELLASLAD